MSELICKVHTDGTKCWYNEEGLLHREDGPAVEYVDGDKEYWYKDQHFYYITTDADFHNLVQELKKDLSVTKEELEDNQKWSRFSEITHGDYIVVIDIEGKLEATLASYKDGVWQKFASFEPLEYAVKYYRPYEKEE